MELVRRVRKITHCRKTPIIMLSGPTSKQKLGARVLRILMKTGRHKTRRVDGREISSKSKTKVTLRLLGTASRPNKSE